MSLLEHLIAADRVVIAGLAAYDKAMASAWATVADAAAADGIPAEQITAAKEAHDDRCLQGRGNLHRELWTKALAMIACGPPASCEPVGGSG